MCENDELWIEHDDTNDETEQQIVNTTRIGIEGAGAEWARLKLRWYLLNNSCVSVRDKQAESVLNSS